MPDVIAAGEDLADAGEKPWQISRLLGLRRDEVFTILRRTGRQLQHSARARVAQT